MQVEVAETAGFCFGVDRAVNAVYKLLEEGKKACTLGPIAHNPQVTGDLREKGVLAVDSPAGAPPGYVLVIRSHGVAREVEEEIERLSVPCVDATCPSVKKIHRLAREAGEQGRIFLLFGDGDHPEVRGITGHCTGEFLVCRGAGELQTLLKNRPDLSKLPIAVAAQTTFHAGEWQNCLGILKKVCTNAVFFATICNATAKRQKEAKALAQKCHRMVVIGGRDSSNTAKLRDICAEYCGP